MEMPELQDVGRATLRAALVFIPIALMAIQPWSQIAAHIGQGILVLFGFLAGALLFMGIVWKALDVLWWIVFGE